MNSNRKFLLIGGQPNTGKSSTISRIFLTLSSNYTKITNINFTKTTLPPTFPLQDFSALLEGVNKNGLKVKILVHSATDDRYNIDLLEDYINNYQPNIVICSIRDIGWERNEVLRIVNNNYHIEIPLAKVTRRGKHSKLSNNNFNNSLYWYIRSIDKIIIQQVKSPVFDLL